MQTRTRTRTVVFTDMADYTKSVLATDREGLRNLLEMHQRFVEPALTGHGGRVVKNIGDSFMAVFESATDGVRACMDLIEAHVPSQGSSVSFRAGIATGDVEESADDAFGEPVNLAARIIAKAPTGEVWFSKGTWHCINQAEIPWESTGRHTLKGIAGEVEILRAVPKHAAFLPDVLVGAIRGRTLVRWQSGDPIPALPPNAHVLFEGYRPGSGVLAEALDHLPLLDPGHIWLCTYNISPIDRFEWARSGRGLVIATPNALRTALKQHEKVPNRPAGSETIILDTGGTSVLELVIAGLALPAVPLSEVVAGYTYDLLADGRWLNRSERAVLRVEVGSAGVAVTVLGPGVQVGGQVAAINAVIPLHDGVIVGTPAGPLTYRVLNQEGYTGVLVGDSPVRLSVGSTQLVELGREPAHPGMLLPDRSNQDNIRWLNGPRAARAREKGYTLDKVLTGRRQTAVSASALDRIDVVPLHETCATFLLDEQRQLHRLSAPRAARVGDLVLLGTTVIALREPPR